MERSMPLQFLVLLSFLLLSTAPAHDRAEGRNQAPILRPPADTLYPKNIILLIGDGMGLTQVTAGMYSNNNTLNLEQFPVTGMMKTHAHRNLITDSAAGATAFSCGCKTTNGTLGMTSDKKICTTILESARAKGLAVGLLATCSITHATPAAFVAHVESRAEMEQIAAFYPRSGIDLLIGGGLKYFNARTKDQRNLIDEMIQAGYQTYLFSDKKITEITADPSKPFAWFSATDEPESVLKGRDYLAPATALSAEYLHKRSEKGFFLMVEGSQIDWACHAKDGPRAIAEMLDFDQAIGEALKFAASNKETLLIVTADHETGGMAIDQGSTKDSLHIEFNTGQHTASLVPVFAYGPGSSLFHGIMDNTEIYWKMKSLLRL
jgi:alkaline phosphatase